MTPPSLPRRRAGVLRPSMRTARRQKNCSLASVLQAARLRHSPRATQAARGYIYKVVLLLRKGRRRPGRSRRRLVRRADVIHASVAREVAVHAAVDVRPNGEAGAVRAQRDRGARLIAGVLAVDVFAKLGPVGPIVLEDAGVA